MVKADHDATMGRVSDLLKRSRSLLFITGAGLSADSGLPTYRGIGGLYDDRSTEDDIPIETALSGMMMATNPGLCWKYIAQIERACRDARHNRGHEVIAAIEQRWDRVWTLTQNVDGFHRSAGSEQVIDIHGDIHALRCVQCPETWRVNDYRALEIPPSCPSCGAVVRPDVVLFGEMLPADKVRTLSRVLSYPFDLIFTVGTTSVFPYIAGPVVEACRAGVPTVEINPGGSEVSDLVTLRLRAGAAGTLDELWALATGG